MKVDLKLDMIESIMEYGYIHPQAMMDNLGIKYDSFHIYTISDSWVFKGCELNEDCELPSCLSFVLERKDD